MKRIFKNEMGFEIELEDFGNRIEAKVRYPFSIRNCFGYNKNLKDIEDIRIFKEEIKEILKEAKEIRGRVEELEIYLKAYLHEQGFTEQEEEE